MASWPLTRELKWVLQGKFEPLKNALDVSVLPHPQEMPAPLEPSLAYLKVCLTHTVEGRPAFSVS